LQKSANRLQGSIFQVDTFEFDEIQMKADESQASNYSALSIDDWSEQELIDGMNASPLEQIHETNGILK
jgi:hypothetical protein